MQPRLPAILALLSLICLLLAACGAAPPSPSPAPGGSLHAFPELEARLPSQVDGHEMRKVSVNAPPDQQAAKTLELLRRLSRTPDDLQVAIASGEDGADIQVGAFRVVGSEGVQIAVHFQSVDEADPASTAVYGTATINGKRLLTRLANEQLTYLYPAEDIMFMLSGDEALIEKALALLP